MSHLDARMHELARQLEAPRAPQETMAGVVDSAVALVAACTSAGITVAVRGHRVEVEAATDQVPLLAAGLESTLGEGPCVDTVWRERVVSSPDLEADPRWPRWAPAVVHGAAVRSMVCVRLFTHDHRVGVLVLYADRTRAFTAEDVDTAVALAAHAAVEVAEAHRVEHLRAALDHRTVIGQATGLLAGTYRMTSSAAFAVLERLAQQQGRRLPHVAAEYVRLHDAELRLPPPD